MFTRAATGLAGTIYARSCPKAVVTPTRERTSRIAPHRFDDHRWEQRSRTDFVTFTLVCCNLVDIGFLGLQVSSTDLINALAAGDLCGNTGVLRTEPPWIQSPLGGKVPLQ